MFSHIIICLSAFISEPDARLFERAIWEHGFASYYMTHADTAEEQNCTAVIYSAEQDMTQPTYMFYDGEVSEWTGKRRTLTYDRANDLLTAWTAWRPHLTDLVLANSEHMGADLFDTLQLAAEVDGLCSDDCNDGASDILDRLAEEGAL